MAMAAKSDVSANGQESGKPAPKRRGQRLLWIVLAFMLALAAAPAIVSKTPLRNVVLAGLLRAASIEGEATIGSLSVGWLSTIAATDLELRDNDGQVVAILPALSMDKTLFGLLLDRSDLGHIRMERPTIELRLQEKDSNAGDAFVVSSPKGRHDAAGVGADLEIVDGKVILHNLPGDREWTLEPTTLELRVPPGGAGAIDVKFSAASSGLNVSLAGSIENPRTTRDVRLDGTVQYDRAQLEPLLAARTAGKVILVGEATEPFTLRGSLGNKAPEQPVWENLTGDAKFGWQAATAYGFETGPAQIEVQLAGGVVRLLPLTIDVSGGRLTLAPRVRLAAAPLLEMDAGRVVDHVHVSPEMCNAWMKFALPVLADVTEVDGEFSLDMEGCRLPLASAATGETAGTITVHAIELGPGPLAQQFLPIVETLRDKLHIGGGGQPFKRVSVARESQIEFRMTEGRVYHRGLRLEFPQMTVETYGSVGLDESLAMMAEISLPDKWLGKGPIGTTLKSQPLKLPIGGTLKHPKLDTQQLRDLGRQTIRETAKGLLGNEIERGLNRLFKPKEE